MPFCQFSGRPSASCLDTGMSLVHDIKVARNRKHVSSFLTLDIKGFFDHVDHDRMVHVLWEKDFPLNICRWVRSFLTNRSASVRIDDFLSPIEGVAVGVPQGSPASPVLACMYSSSVMEYLYENPVYSSSSIPVCPRAYIDDLGLHVASNSLHENVLILNFVLQCTIKALARIGMSIDTDKCDLMHFSWRKGSDGKTDKQCSSPSLKTSIYGKKITITPPSSIQWLGFFLDQKLSWNHHVKVMMDWGLNVVNGLTCLGNTIRGLALGAEGVLPSG